MMRRLQTLLLISALLRKRRRWRADNSAPMPRRAKPTPTTLTVNSQLVVETVVVKDKQGKFVSGLTAKDFT